MIHQRFLQATRAFDLFLRRLRGSRGWGAPEANDMANDWWFYDGESTLKKMASLEHVGTRSNLNYLDILGVASFTLMQSCDLR